MKPGQFRIYSCKGIALLGGETKKEKKSEKDEFQVYLERQKEKGKLQVN
jgi:hypothetical protein